MKRDPIIAPRQGVENRSGTPALLLGFAFAAGLGPLPGCFSLPPWPSSGGATPAQGAGTAPVSSGRPAERSTAGDGGRDATLPGEASPRAEPRSFSAVLPPTARILSKDFHANGAVKRVEALTEDSDGPLTVHAEWYPNGNLKLRGYLRTGTPVGHWSYYYDNGVRHSTGAYANGSRTGYWSFWSARGHLTRRQFYKTNGELIVTILDDHDVQVTEVRRLVAFHCIYLPGAQIAWGYTPEQFVAATSNAFERHPSSTASTSYYRNQDGTIVAAFEATQGLFRVQYSGALEKHQSMSWISMLSQAHGLPREESTSSLMSRSHRYDWNPGAFTIRWTLHEGFMSTSHTIVYELLPGNDPRSAP